MEIAVYNGYIYRAWTRGFQCPRCQSVRREVHLAKQGVPCAPLPLTTDRDLLWLVPYYRSKSGLTYREGGAISTGTYMYAPDGRRSGAVVTVPAGGTIAVVPDILRRMSRYHNWYTLETSREKSPFPGFCKADTTVSVVSDQVRITEWVFRESVCPRCKGADHDRIETEADHD